MAKKNDELPDDKPPEEKQTAKPKTVKVVQIECFETCTFANRLFKPGMTTEIAGEIPPHFKEIE